MDSGSFGFHKKEMFDKIISGLPLNESVLAEETYWYSVKNEERKGHMDVVREHPLVFPRNAAILVQEKSPQENLQDLLSFVCRTWEAELSRPKSKPNEI